jgi:signal transduction histidine kinase
MILQEFFNNLSIKTKLSLVIMIACTFVLFLISSVVLVVEVYSSRTSLVHEMRILGEGVRIPAIRGQRVEAGLLLQSLSQQPNIHAAYLLNSHGEPLAEYLDVDFTGYVVAALENDFTPEIIESLKTHGSERQISSWTHFSIFMPIIHDGRYVGTLYLLSDLHALYGGAVGVAFGGGMALLLLISFSWLLAGRMQQPISVPLIELSELMHEVSAKGHYSVRAIPRSRDEIGQLVSGFNSMLEKIEFHQHNLIRHQQELESTVAERTCDLREAMAELEVARKQADIANEAKSVFLSSMTHELRTPMIGVLGMNELLARTSLDERQRMLVETVQRSGADLLHLIKDILDFSKIEAGQLTLETADVDLFSVGEDVIELLGPSATEKGLSLESSVPLEVAWKVRADEQRIRQIVMNLVGNAIKFTDSGFVRMSLQLEQIEAGRGLFVFDVEDSGPGMDEAATGRIFELFYQIDGSNTREQSGSGLGLAIVKQLVELMDGELQVRSQPGQGSCFSVRLWLPLLQSIDFSLPEELCHCSALICAGDLAAGAVVELKERLQVLGIRVAEAASSDETLSLLVSGQRIEEPYCFVFVAYDLYLLDGTRLYETLKQQQDSIASRVIVLSGDQTDIPVAAQRLDLPLTWKRLITTLCLSCHEPDQVGLQGTVPVQGEGMTEVSILIVSSNIAKRELLRLTFEPGFSGRVKLVACPSSARQYLVEMDPSCVVVDVTDLSTAECSQLVSGLENRPCLVAVADREVSSEVAGLFDKLFVHQDSAILAGYVVHRLMQKGTTAMRGIV